MKVAYLMDQQKIQIKEEEQKEPQNDEIAVRLEYCGICGSDVHFFENGCIGTTKVSYPFILGHECAGTVVATGSNVKNLKPGDRVTLEPGVPCGKCEFCKQGRYNLCPNVKFLAAPPVNGAFREVINFPAHMVFKLPNYVSTLEGSMIEPLAVGMQAAETAGIKPGKSVLILGCGCIGLVTLMACRAAGAGQIVVADLYQNRLQQARELGADIVFDSRNELDFMKMRDFTQGEGYDCVFETSGSAVVAQQTSYMVRRGGTIVMVGNVVGNVPFNFRNLYLNEACVKSVFRYRNQYPSAIQQVATGIIPIKKIVSHIYEFDQIQEAFEKAAFHKDEVVKIAIRY